MSRCDEVQELLWPLDGPREVVEGEADARLHLQSCPTCQAFFKRDTALGIALQVDVETPASDRLRARVTALLDDEVLATARERRRPGFARRLTPWLAAAAALVVAGVGLLRPDPDDLNKAYVEAYRTTHVHMAALDAPTADQVYEFFMTELGSPVMPTVISSGTMSRARVCAILGQSSAVVDYELQGHKVAHYRLPAGSWSRLDEVRSETEDGVCVVRWSDDEYDHAIVADIPEDQLVDIAQQQFAALR